MRTRIILILSAFCLVNACTSEKKLAYLNNLPKTGEEQRFTMSPPEYKIQARDVLYITVKAMDPDGKITDFLGGANTAGSSSFAIGGGSSFLIGYTVNKEGNLILPVAGVIKAEGKTLDETRIALQNEFNKSYKNATVDCKLLSFKYTVIGEVKAPGTFYNYSDYLTVLEAIGQAGGVDDYGRRDNILIVRPLEKGTKTFTLNLQDKNILTSEAYFLMPNDVIIVQPQKQKLFNINFPVFSAVLTTITGVLTTTLLLINYFGK
ncbi:MAG: polysaccharide biosynthesis/export family protein [Bacteroidales bacterium]|jgi:polysaccharide export outer membrane protein